MTSAISLRKYLRQQLQERKWLTLLISIVCFLALPAGYLMYIQNAARFIDGALPDYKARVLEQRLEEALSWLGFNNQFINICVIIAAFLTALSCFIWLYQKDRSDFSFGLAIRREKQFDVFALTGAIIAVVPYLAATLICLFVISPIYGILTPELIQTALLAAAWRILSYFGIYFVIIAAVLLAGRNLPGLLISAFFLGYGPCLIGMFQMLMSGSFSTYCTSLVERSQLFIYLSPAVLLFAMPADWSEMAPFLCVAVMALYAVGGYLISRRLFKARPSETAGAPLTYPGMMLFLKVIVTIPCAMAAGGMVASLSNDDGIGWLAFGCFMGALVVGGIMEFIESSDLNMIVKHWKSAAFAFIAALLILLFFRYDPLGYDTYLPSKDNVAAMAVQEDAYMGIYGNYYSPGTGQKEVFSELDLLDMSRTADFDVIYELARGGVDYVKTMKDGAVDSSFENKTYENVTILYELTSGRKVYRRYNIEKEKLDEAAASLAKQPEYSRALVPFQYMDPTAFNTVTIEPFEYADGANYSITLDQNEREQLAEALKADGFEASYEQLCSETPLAILTLWFETTRYNYSYEDPFGKMSGLEEFYLYPSYTRTAAFLKDHGFAADPEKAAANIIDITVDIPYDEPETYNADATNYRAFKTYEIYDPAGIEALLKAVTRVRFREYDRGNCELNYRTSTGSRIGYTIKVTDQEQFDAVIAEYATLIADETLWGGDDVINSYDGSLTVY